MSFMAAAMTVAGTTAATAGIGTAMLAGGMMGGAMTMGTNLLSGRDVFSNIGQGMLTGAAGSGIVSGLGSLAGGATEATQAAQQAAAQEAQEAARQAAAQQSLAPGQSQFSDVTKFVNPPAMSTPSMAPLEPIQYQQIGGANTFDPYTSEGLNPANNGVGGVGTVASAPPAPPPIASAAPDVSQFTQQPIKPAEFMKNPADYMVQNPSKVAAIGSGLNSMFSQPTPPQPKAGPGGNRYEYNYQPAQYDSNGRIIKPASYGTPTVTHYAAAGGTIYGNDSGKGPYNDKGGIYGSDGPMYTDSNKYSGLMAQMHKMSPTLLSRYAKAAKDAAVQAAAQKELYAREVAPADYGDDVTAAAGGGLMSLNTYAAGGKLLQGPGDGMSDSIPAVIQGAKPQRAALAQGEFVIPADVVSHLGNGSTDAGAKRLYSMMDKVRHARTGNKKQGRQINPNRFLPA